MISFPEEFTGPNLDNNPTHLAYPLYVTYVFDGLSRERNNMILEPQVWNESSVFGVRKSHPLRLLARKMSKIKRKVKPGVSGLHR